MNNNSYKTLLLDTDEQGICILTINRPDKLNALNKLVLDELNAALDQIGADKQIKGVIVTGAGEKAFVAGADIAELAKLDGEGGKSVSRKGQDIFSRIENFTKPFIAVVNGYALGGGCELAMACHLRVAGQKAMFGLPEVGLGLIPGYGGTQRLPRLVGKGRALEMILSGKPIKADIALAIGLVNRLVSNEEMMNEAMNLMSAILSKGPVAVGNAIRAVNHSAGDPGEGFEMEAKLFGDLCETNDFKEGTEAFLSKRSPNFIGN